MKFSHTTVLQNEMVSHVLTNTNGTYVDCTLGGGGHSLALAEGLSNLGCIIGVDQDGEAIEAAKERLRGAQCKFISVRDNFSNINGILKENGIEKVDGFIFDLGVSSHQLDDGTRGFSYMNNGKLGKMKQAFKQPSNNFKFKDGGSDDTIDFDYSQILFQKS